jgi:hypothetical protein
VPVVAVVKEEELPTPVEEEKKLGLVDFQDDYFCGPLYLDPEREFYQALGNKPIFSFGSLGKALINPLKARRELKEMGERFKDKGVEGNMVGDGLTKGGIFVVAPDGEIKFTFYEDPGKGVPQEEARQIIAAAKAMAGASAPVR